MIHDEVFLIFILGTIIIITFATSLILFVIQYKRRQQLHVMEKMNLENTYQNQLLQSRLEVQEQSFKYFSEEIHDNIGQLLSMVKMQLYNIKSSSTEPEIVKKATNSNELLGKAINDLRNISHTLNSGFIDSAGLEAAIRKDLDYICSAREIKCDLFKTGEEYGLGAERELLIFRIVQEAIGNAIKHANPNAIDVRLIYTPDALTVTITDDGSGFNAVDKTTSGLGLTNMQERAKLLQGKIDINSQPGTGTTVRLEINHAA